MVRSGSVSPVEPSVLETWTSAPPPLGGPGVAAAATAAETVLGAYLINTETASSSEQMSQPEPSSLNLSEPTSSVAGADPVVQRTEAQSFKIGDFERNAGVSAALTEEIAGSVPVEQGRPSAESAIDSSEAPTAAIPVVHQSLWARREHLPVPAPPEPPRGDELQTIPLAAISSQKPDPQEDLDAPWWLSYVPRQYAEQSIPLLWQGEKTGKSRDERPPLAPDPVEFPLHADPPRNADTSTPKPADSHAQPPLSERRADPEAQPASLPLHAPAQWAEPEDSPARLTSRLSGLRRLLAGLGPKEPHPSTGTVDPERSPVTPLDRGSVMSEQPTLGGQSSENASPPPSEPSDPESRESSPQPALLKPAAPIAEHEVEDSQRGEEPQVRTSRPDTEIEPLTLPSKRGQYSNL
jgi:hypothetical protein